MQYRRFGRTELQMPVFSCGGMRYQYQWQDMPISGIPRDSQENLEATIRRSLEVGINHIETARGYGTSEVQLGQILPKLPRDKMIVQTKIVPMRNVREFRRTFEQSLANLQLDYVDLFALHGVNDAEALKYAIGWGGCLKVAQQLRKEGKVRFIGLSTHAPKEIILKAIKTNQFDYINLHWYYINQNNWQAIEAATQQNMGVFIISPSNKGGMLYEAPQRLVELCAPISPIVFNDLFCLSQSQVHTLSVGAAKPEDFDEHLKTLPLLDQAKEILPPILERLEQAAIHRFAAHFGNGALGENWFRTWHLGLPTPDKTPGNLNIPVILWLWNLAIAYDMMEYGKMRYNLLGEGGSWFPGNRAETVNPDTLHKCLRNSPHAAIIPGLLKEAHQLLGGAAVKRLSQQ